MIRMPELARQARAAQDEDSYQSAPIQQRQVPEYRPYLGDRRDGGDSESAGRYVTK